jgi:catechol 2,3-dioxygenase-like lactoylglutathione lyase family enzyme
MKLFAVSLDCPDPNALAAFYAELLGWKVGYSNEDSAGVQGDGPTWIGFQRVENYQAPSWPSQETPQQSHLDIAVAPADLPGALEHAEAVGAVRAGVQPNPERWTVFLDPAGHPFCVFAD